jgi:hypothetical protein
VVLTGNDDDLLVSDFINESMLIRQAARPIAFEFVFKGFGFTDAVERRLCRFDNDAPDALEKFLIRLRPLTIIIKSCLMKSDDPH